MTHIGPPGSPGEDAGDGHLGDVLSAYLDDELAPAARHDVDAHLAGCGECRAELDDIAAARRAIRTLPVHAAPWPIADDLVRPAARSTRRRVAWAVAAAVAAAIALLLPRQPDVAPSLPWLADSHAARASVTGDPLTQLAPIAVPVRFGP